MNVGRSDAAIQGKINLGHLYLIVVEGSVTNCMKILKSHIEYYRIVETNHNGNGLEDRLQGVCMLLFKIVYEINKISSKLNSNLKSFRCVVDYELAAGKLL